MPLCLSSYKHGNGRANCRLSLPSGDDRRPVPPCRSVIGPPPCSCERRCPTDHAVLRCIMPAALLVRAAMADGICCPQVHEGLVLAAASRVRAAKADGSCRPKVHNVLVLAVASLVRAAMADGSCPLEVHKGLVLAAALLVQAAMIDGSCRLGMHEGLVLAAASLGRSSGDGRRLMPPSSARWTRAACRLARASDNGQRGCGSIFCTSRSRLLGHDGLSVRLSCRAGSTVTRADSSWITSPTAHRPMLVL